MDEVAVLVDVWVVFDGEEAFKKRFYYRGL